MLRLVLMWRAAPRCVDAKLFCITAAPAERDCGFIFVI
jgi:hypothetical protein